MKRLIIFMVLISIAISSPLLAEGAKESEGKTIRVLLEDTPWHRNIENTISQFEEQSGYEVSLEFLPEVQSREKVNLDLTTGTGLYDVFLTDQMYIQKFAKLDSLEPLDKYVEGEDEYLSDFPKLALETHTHMGNLYGIPWRTAMNILAYRVDLLEKYDVAVPSSYSELMDAAIKVREGLIADGEDDVYGIIARGLRGEGLNMWIIGSSIFPAFCGNWFDENGEPTINSPQMVEGLDYYATLLQKAGSPDAPSHSWDDCSRLFYAGKGAFYIDSAIQIVNLYSEGGEIAENVGTTLIPEGPCGRHPGLYTPAYVMSAKAQNKEAAWEFIKWATSPEQMLSDAVDGGNYEIASKSAIQNPEFEERFPYPELNKVLLDSQKYAREERPMIIAWPQVGDIVGEVAQRCIAGKVTAQEALDEAQKRVMEIYREQPDSFK